MNKIYKYNFGPLTPGIQTITVNNKIVHIMDFQEQNYDLVMWASVGAKIEPQDITIDVSWTGDPEPNKTYFKTIQGSDGLVYHVYI